MNRKGSGNRFLSRALVLGSFVLLKGCSLFPQREARVERQEDGVIVVTYPAEMRGAYLIPGEKIVTVCSEPAPDVALKSVSELSGKLGADVTGTGKLDAQAVAKVAAEAFQLAGRTQLVLVAREMLYSLCTVSRNNKLTPEQIAAVYTEVSKVITTLAEADKKNAQARYLEAVDQAHTAVETEADKVKKILAYITDAGGNLVKGGDGKYTKLEELFTRIDQGGGRKLSDPIKNKLRHAANAAELKRLLTDVTDTAIDPLYDALIQ